MRARALVALPLGLALLACTGAIEAPSGDDEAIGNDDGAGPGKKKRKRPGKAEDGQDEEDGQDGEDGDDGSPGDGGGGGAGDGGGGGGGGGAAPKPSPAPSSPPEGVEQVDATTWKVSEAKKDEWMNNPSKFGGAGKKGKGYELRALTSDANFIGLRNGDIVKEVNGYSLDTETEALAAYAALQNAKKLNVKLRRGDSPVNLTYLITK